MAEAAVDTARPRFFKEPVQNIAKSAAEGRPIYDEQEFVEIRHPGDKTFSFVEAIDDRTSPERPGEPSTREKYSARWPREYAAFKRGESRAASGTPLEQWPQLARARVAELKAHDILTVEEYAAAPDAMLGRLGMGTRAEREQAKAFLTLAKDSAANAQLAAENAQLKERLDRLEQQMALHAPEPAGDAAPAAPREKPLEECTDAELKDFIKRETGERVRGNPHRDALLARAAEVARLIQERA